MSGVSKINGIALANVGKVNNVAKANLGKVSGITVPSAAYSSANSLLFDGTNERANTSLTMTTDVGSVSLWFKFGQTVGTDWIFMWHNYSTAGNFNDGYMDIRLQNNSNSPAARHLIFSYKNTAGTTLAGSAGSRAGIKLNGGETLILALSTFANIYIDASTSSQFVNVAYFK